MLLAIGQHLEDEFKLDRLLPYLIALLGDEVGLVRANTLKTLTNLASIPVIGDAKICVLSVSSVNSLQFTHLLFANY